jgi:hypothetical protein
MGPHKDVLGIDNFPEIFIHNLQMHLIKMTFSKQYGRENISRRTFLQRAIAISLTLITVWGGAELDSFNAVLAPFRHMQHITVNIESTRDLNATLTSRLRGNNPPDIRANASKL